MALTLWVLLAGRRPDAVLLSALAACESFFSGHGLPPGAGNLGGLAIGLALFLGGNTALTLAAWSCAFASFATLLGRRLWICLPALLVVILAAPLVPTGNGALPLALLGLIAVAAARTIAGSRATALWVLPATAIIGANICSAAPLALLVAAFGGTATRDRSGFRPFLIGMLLGLGGLFLNPSGFHLFRDLDAGLNSAPAQGSAQIVSYFLIALWLLANGIANSGEKKIPYILGLCVLLIAAPWPAAWWFAALAVLPAALDATRPLSIPTRAQFWTVLLLSLGVALTSSLVVGGRWLLVPPDLVPWSGSALLAPQTRGAIYYNTPIPPLLAGRLQKYGNATPGGSDTLNSPARWREMDRAKRFDTVVLIGNASSFAPLLEHLMTSPDFRLARIDPAGFRFERGPRSDALPAIPDARLAPRDRAEVLAAAARRLIEVKRMAQAQQVIDLAAKADPTAPGVTVARAIFAASSGRWEESAAAANTAVKADSGDLAARMIRAEACLRLGRIPEAWGDASFLVAANRGDPAALWLHARVAHAAHDYNAETASLSLLVSLSEAAHSPAGIYRVYLAQSLAHQGKRMEALRQFRAAIDAPEMTPDQRAKILESVKGLGGESKSDRISP